MVSLERAWLEGVLTCESELYLKKRAGRMPLVLQLVSIDTWSYKY